MNEHSEQNHPKSILCDLKQVDFRIGKIFRIYSVEFLISSF